MQPYITQIAQIMKYISKPHTVYFKHNTHSKAK